jgi:hypothetical protein
MAIFAVISQPGPNAEKLPEAIKRNFPDGVYDVGSGIWLISGRGPAKEVSDQLGVTDGSNGSAIVIEVASYFGRANPAIWSWIQSNWERTAIG